MRITETMIAVLMLLNSMFLNTSNITLDCSKDEQYIQSFLWTYDHIESDVTFVKELYDINGKNSFLLFSIDSNGYAVMTESGMISEIIYGNYNLDSLAEWKYYVGPSNLLTDEQYKDYSELLTENELARISNISSLICKEELGEIEYQHNMSKNDPITTKPSIIVGGTEVGISESKMTMYNAEIWQNSSSLNPDYMYLGFGICGTISTAICLSYIDNEKNNNIIVSAPYSNNTNDFAYWLIMLLRAQIEPPLPGSFASDIISGINWFYGTNYSNLPANTLKPKKSTSESVYKSNLYDEYPLIMYLDDFTPGSGGSPYGLHWVAAYRYVEYNNALWFKAIDLWGNCAWINRHWINCVVYYQH